MPLWNGYPVDLTDWLTETETTRTPRTWRERLTPRVRSRFPTLLVSWTPWRAETIVTRTVPSKSVLRMHERLIMHPQTFRALQGAIRE